MSTFDTLFEKVHGKYTLETFLPLVLKHYELKDNYKEKLPQIVPSSAAFLTTLGVLSFSSLSAEPTIIIGAALGGSAYVACEAIIKNLLQHKSVDKLLSFSKIFSKSEAEYDNAHYHFLKNLSYTKFQIELFDTLNNLKENLKSIYKHIYTLEERQRTLQELIYELEVSFSQKKYEDALEKIKNSAKWLCEIFIQSEAIKKLSDYRESLASYKDNAVKKEEIESEIALELEQKHKYDIKAML